MTTQALKYYRFDALLQQQGWMKPAYVGVDVHGKIKYISENSPAAPAAIESVGGVALPGFQNAHSHAFQYAMAGMAEKHIPGSVDDFWTWREAMYECALAMNPDQVEAVAAMLYEEMLRKGYTHVAEFHYLHHDPNGRPYDNLAEMAERLISAASLSGIKITLIPIFYQKGGFNRDPELRQCRFISKTVDEYLALLEASRATLNTYADANLAFGVHSLRAVTASDIFRTLEVGPREMAFHIHAAEQKKEVADCLFHLKQRPVEWLLNNLPLQERFNLVHCTHLNDDEVRKLAQTRANVILCPGTEGNLGDGIFRLTEFARFYGNWCIGTDSHITLNPLEDLRWLDYTQRLTSNRRNTFDDTATVFMNKTIPCGRRAMGLRASNFFELEKALDCVVYNSNSALLNPENPEHLLPSILYTSDSHDVYGTMVNGKWVVKNHQTKNGQETRLKYRKAVKEILF